MKLASIQYWIYVDGISNKKTTQIIGNLVSGLHLTNKQSYFAVGKEERSSKKKKTQVKRLLFLIIFGKGILPSLPNH